jgi:hypothetical protein
MAKKLLLIGVVVLIAAVALIAALGRGGTKSVSSTPATTASPAAPARSSTKPAAGHLRAAPRAVTGTDAVSWHVVSSYTTHRIENAYGVSATASGTYLVMDITASNGGTQAMSLTGLYVSLEIAGVGYPLDTGALSALELSGPSALPAAIAAGATAKGWVVFDVPTTASTSNPQLCFQPTIDGVAATASCSV